MDKATKTSDKSQSLFNWRGTIVGILGCLALIFLTAEPAEDAANWFLLLLGSQGIGYAFGAASLLLFNKWEKEGYFTD